MLAEVDLVAVVGRRVVGGREHDARGGAEVAHRKGQRGNGLDARIDVDVDAIGRQHAGRHALEVLALVARVTRERQRGVLVVGVQVVRHALGGLRDHVDVHAVGAHAERAAQARRAKGEVAIEGVEEFVLVALAAELVELDHQVGLGDVVLPGADLGLDACVHVVSPICSGRGCSPRRIYTYEAIVAAPKPRAVLALSDGCPASADGGRRGRDGRVPRIAGFCESQPVVLLAKPIS